MTTFKEVLNFQCRVFEPKTSELSEKELKMMLKQLYEYFPYTVDKETGDKQPYETDADYSKKWYKCYDHLLTLINNRRQDFRYKVSLWLSILAIVISVFGVVARLGQF